MRKDTDVQATRDIRRAAEIVRDVYGGGAEMLQECAADLGLSVHAVALAVLSGECPEILDR